ncbi:MAG: hypothetical protein KF894_33765, partial [Labilithrix sp.]|nr:hypothetical protein [Labilithrix sp.]
MKNDDPRTPRGGYSDPGERDTRLDPIEDLPDATQPGSLLTSRAAADLVTPHTPQPAFGAGAPAGPRPSGAPRPPAGPRPSGAPRPPAGPR